MRRSLTVVFIAMFFLAGCVTNYQGKGPNFSLKGEEANREIEKFTLHTDFLEHGTMVYEMGPEKTDYWTSSLKPMMSEVSPSSTKILDRAEWWDNASLIFLAIATGILAGSDRSKTSWVGPFYTAIGLSVGSSTYSYIIAGEAAEQYNYDLRKKFSPEVSFLFPLTDF